MNFCLNMSINIINFKCRFAPFTLNMKFVKAFFGPRFINTLFGLQNYFFVKFFAFKIKNNNYTDIILK